MVRPENIYTSNSIQSEQVIIQTTINEKEVMNFKESIKYGLEGKKKRGK